MVMVASIVIVNVKQENVLLVKAGNHDILSVTHDTVSLCTRG